MLNNFALPTEATHSSLDIFEKPPLLVTFDHFFEQKTEPLSSPSDLSLEFEVRGPERIQKYLVLLAQSHYSMM